MLLYDFRRRRWGSLNLIYIDKVSERVAILCESHCLYYTFMCLASPHSLERDWWRRRRQTDMIEQDGFNQRKRGKHTNKDGFAYSKLSERCYLPYFNLRRRQSDESGQVLALRC